MSSWWRGLLQMQWLSAIECNFKIHNIIQYFDSYDSDGCMNDELSDDSEIQEGKNHTGDSAIEATPAPHRQRWLLISLLTGSLSSLTSEASNSTPHKFEGPTAASNGNRKPKSNVWVFFSSYLWGWRLRVWSWVFRFPKLKTSPTDAPVVNSMSSLLISANFKDVHLNTASFSASSALFINLKNKNIKNIHTLINSGASDCFINSWFTLDNQLPLSNLKTLLWLPLFDGSTATQGLIVQFTTLNVSFPCGTHHNIWLLLTPLACSMTIVLGYSWLHLHNLLIDWVVHELRFQPQSENKPSVEALSLTIPGAHPELSEPPESLAPPISPPMLLSDPSPSNELQAATASISISFVKAPALSLLSHLPPSHPYAILCMGIIELPTCGKR